MTEREARELAESMALLLMHPPGGQQEVKLRLAHAQALLLQARAALLRSKEARLGPADAKLLLVARSDLAKALKIPGLSAADRAQILYLAGLSYVYSDDPGKALPYLEKSHASHAKGSSTREWIAIYLAEEHFERGDFARALPYYAESVQASPYRDLARYKTAWCQLNLKRLPEAEASFMALAKDPAGGAFAKDSLKDLAFLSARFRDDSQTLDLVKRLGLSGEARMDFLRRVQDQREAQNDMNPDSPVFRSLLATEKDPGRRVKLRLSAVRGTQRQYADARHLSTVEDLFSEVRRARWNAETPAFLDFSDPIEQETRRILRSFVETYAGRTKSPDPAFSKPSAAAKALGRLFALYEAYFPKSPRLAAVLELRADVCQSEKDWTCVKESSRRMLELEGIADSSRASSEIRLVEACDQLKAYQGSAEDPACRSALESFVASREAAPEWESAASRLVELRVVEKKNAEAVLLLEKIWKKAPKAAVFERIQKLRFDSDLLDEVLADPRSAKVASDDVRAVLREAHLRKTLQEREAGSEEGYRKHLESFLALSPDPAKAAVARADLVRFFLEKGNSVSAVKELLRVAPGERLRPPFRSLVLETGYERLKEGDASVAVLWKEAARSKKAMGADLLLVSSYADLAAGRWPPMIDSLPTADRTHLWGLLVLSHPRSAVVELSKRKKLDKNERSLLLFALRLDRGQWVFPVDSRSARLLGTALPLAMKPASDFPLLAKIRALPPTPKNAKGRALEKAIERGSAALRSLRLRYTKEAGRLPADLRSSSARDLAERERALGEAILRSPVPSGLAASEREQYKAALTEAAQEFLSQAENYSRIADESASGSQPASDDALPLSAFSEHDWPWPAEAAPWVERWRKDARSGRLDRALAGLDAAKVRGLSGEDALVTRAGLLLVARPSIPARRFVISELKKGGRGDLLGPRAEALTDDNVE
jgi:hypothetical protein